MENSSSSRTCDRDIGKPRLIIGGALFVSGFLSPLLLPLVTRSDLPGSWKVFLSTGLLVGLPEVFTVLAVVVLGKQGLVMFKEKLFSMLRKHVAPAAVSVRRHRLGLFMFLAPLATGWLWPYFAHFFPILSSKPLLTAVILDLLFASSFLVLGPEFWGKIRSLFVYDYE